MPPKAEQKNSSFTVVGGRSYETMVVNLSLHEGMRLGIDVLPVNLVAGPHCRGLNIQRVTSHGAVAMWNMSQGPGRSIMAADCIVKLNNIVDDIPAMMVELLTKREFRLEILRQAGALLQQPELRTVASISKQPPEGPWFQRDAAESHGRPHTTPKSAGCPLSRMPLPRMASSRPSDAVTPEPASEAFAHTDLYDLPQAGADDGQTSTQSVQSGRPSVKGQQLTFDVEKPVGVRLGIDVMLVTGSSLCGLIVERVTPGGCVAEWNKRSSSRRRVQPGDYIIQVNGIGSWHNVNLMAEELRAVSRHARFTVQRGLRKHFPGPAAAASNEETVPPEATPQTPQSQWWLPPPEHAVSETELNRPKPPLAPSSTQPSSLEEMDHNRQIPSGPMEAPLMPPMTTLGRSAGGLSKIQVGDSQPSPTSLPQPRLARLGAQSVSNGMKAPSTVPVPFFASTSVAPHEVRSATTSMGRPLVTEDPRVDRSRASCGPVAPIGAGRGAPGAALPLPGWMRPPAVGGQEEEMKLRQGDAGDRSSAGCDDGSHQETSRGAVADVPGKPRCDSLSNVWHHVAQDAGWLPPALMLSMLKLDDSELAELLNKMLVLRPWLLMPIKKGQLQWKSERSRDRCSVAAPTRTNSRDSSNAFGGRANYDYDG